MRKCPQCNGEVEGHSSKVFCSIKCKTKHDYRKYAYARCKCCLKFYGQEKLECIGDGGYERHKKPCKIYVCHKCMDEQNAANKQTDVEDEAP